MIKYIKFNHNEVDLGNLIKTLDKETDWVGRRGGGVQTLHKKISGGGRKS